MSRRNSSGPPLGSDERAGRSGDSLVGETDGASACESEDLAARLRERIRREGALTFREWMRAALYDERGGYYQRAAQRWGRAGDYRTSPERSTLFAATFARHFASLFEELGRPRVLNLLEVGGGAGHFAHGLLQTLRRDAPHVFDSLRYVFDEPSADSRARAAALLAPFAERVEFRRLTDFSEGEPLENVIVFSNELLDAFPVHRVSMRGGRLRETFVGCGARGEFVWVEGEPSTPRLAEHFERAGLSLTEGQTAEVSLDVEAWVARVARLVGRGFVFTVDYGDEAAGLLCAPHRREGTLRAFRGHELVEDVLRSPSEQDLTTTINWTQVIAAGEAAGLQTVKLERLDSFLLRTGLLEQLERECAHAAGEAEIARLRLDAREMILPGASASHFQLLVQKKV
ncbi:MAG: SAM-dependent methyltransferase [Acidobacteriota bacterium]|nr:SAM-dependent methyltransferase [Acidobacteriota bacterium]MDQ5835499.1 SAM-dependent methyltransferase [Acidobacteriota bacterium]